MSSYPINPNIPAAANDPADDQPGMQTNFANINSYVQVDHTNPGAANAGQHKQVTFNANNVPTLPTTFPILFSNNKDGVGNNLPGSLSEAFLYSGTTSQSANQYVSQGNGSALLLGGIVIKWGQSNVSNGSTVNFASAFPNNCFAVLVTINIGSTVSPVGTNGFNVSRFTFRTTAAGNVPISYFAIGN